MTELFFAAACFVLVTVAFGLMRILHGPTVADRVMAAQLLGTGGIATLLLIGAATGMAAALDVALALALLAAFASAALACAVPDGAGAADRE
ncbi:MAG TPA: monovalent cation/H+ antiporter complex subunit F [Geminicoccaceae bacterium]|nr:monovalent cation/H+ antiporter complex subunit F [Geminicoccaceae bacterium]